MKKLSLLLCISSLSCASIYSSEWNDCDAGPSESAFKISEAPLLRTPACVSYDARKHNLQVKIQEARNELLENLLEKTSEYRKQKNPKDLFITDFCQKEFLNSAKIHQEAGFPFNHKLAFQKISEVAPILANIAFEDSE